MFSWAHLGLVVLGGTIGTAARAALAAAGEPLIGPLFVPAVNVVGAFALGLLVGLLARHADTARARAARMFAGTGILGGFTTYSALAVESAGSPALFALALVGALAGTLAAAAGLLAARPNGRRR